MLSVSDSAAYFDNDFQSADDDDAFALERTGEYITLAQIAAPAKRVRDTDRLRDIRMQLVETRTPALVVVDATDTLVGVLARTDVLRFTDRMDATAKEAMSPFVFALPHIATVERAAALMAYECVSFVIVIGDDRELCGTVSALDVARCYAMEAGFIS
jgi:predicted transcriptional regulator